MGDGRVSTEPPQNRNLDDLDPLTRGLFDTYLKVLRRTFPQFSVIVTETRRTRERQAWLVAQGGNVSRTLYSNHLLGRAIDIAFIRLTTGETDYRPETFMSVYGRLDPRLYGLVSGSQIWNGWDSPHLELLDDRLKYSSLVGTGEDVWLT